MSLVTGLCYRNQFVVVSNDTKVTMQYHDPVTFEPLFDNIIETDIKNDKVHRLTDKVFLSTTGASILCEFIEARLMELVHPEADLDECTEALKQLKIDWETELELEPEKEKLRNFFKSNVTCNLFGFKENGVSGLVDFNPTREIDSIECSLEPHKGYPVILQSPDPIKDREDFYKFLSLPEKEQTLDNFIGRLYTIHAYLSHKHPGISSDCNVHVLYKDGDSIKYWGETLETSIAYKELGLE